MNKALLEGTRIGSHIKSWARQGEAPHVRIKIWTKTAHLDWGDDYVLLTSQRCSAFFLKCPIGTFSAK
jgi:hypothetical protein